MRHWNSRKAVLSLIAILVLVLSLALMSCGDDDGGGNNDELTPQDVAGRTFRFDASLIDPQMTGRAILTFGAADTIDGNQIPFTLTFTDAPDTVIAGIATINSIDLEIRGILVDDEAQEEVIIDGVTFRVGDTFSFETTLVNNEDGSQTITFIGDDGREIVFEFDSPEDTGSSGTGGTGSGD